MALAATDLARRTEAAGFSGMLFTEGHQVPWQIHTRQWGVDRLWS
jgi:alkanesulfonate monooxygenase SsuD/methylene tetrahydromethanopterin reductase-like flavin-dependent oxidoreductase (luciferase family)